MTTKSHYVLRLYVAGMTQRSTEAEERVLVGLELLAEAEPQP
jgi:hypothetical protein